jgi:hypothetical protein
VDLSGSDLSDADRWAEIKSFWLRVLDAVSRLLAAAVFALCDRGFQLVLESTVFRSGTRFLVIVDNIGNVAFLLLDVYLLWDMVAVFVPQLNGRLAIQVAEATQNEKAPDDIN